MILGAVILLVVVGKLRASRRRHMSLTIILEREGHDRAGSDRRRTHRRLRWGVPRHDDADDLLDDLDAANDYKEDEP